MNANVISIENTKGMSACWMSTLIDVFTHKSTMTGIFGACDSNINDVRLDPMLDSELTKSIRNICSQHREATTKGITANAMPYYRQLEKRR